MRSARCTAVSAVAERWMTGRGSLDHSCDLVARDVGGLRGRSYSYWGSNVRLAKRSVRDRAMAVCTGRIPHDIAIAVNSANKVGNKLKLKHLFRINDSTGRQTDY